MNEVVVAVIGGVVVLSVQGVAALARQSRARILSGDTEASPFYCGLRRAGLFGRRRRVYQALDDAAVRQRQTLEAQHAQDPLWRLGQIRVAESAVLTEDVSERLSLTEALARYGQDRGLFVRGDSGSGKSSATSLAASTSTAEMLLLRFDLADYEPDRLLLDQVVEDRLGIKDLERALALRRVGLLFDGFESLTEDGRKSFDGAVGRLVRRYPGVAFAVLSRPEVPATKALLKSFNCYVLPLDTASVREAIAAVGLDADRVVDAMDDRVRTLATSPLALRMLLQSYAAEGALPSNLSQLYQEFVHALVRDEHDSGTVRAAISAAAKLDLLSDLAYSMSNQSVSVDLATAQSWIRPKLVELASRYLIPASVDASEVLQELVRDGIVRSDGRSLRFVHYSVQEFFVALELHTRLSAREVSLAQIADLATRPEFHNSIVFLSGVMSDASSLVRTLRLKNRVLAAECIRTATMIEPALVDKCVVEALYEFKFGRMSFNYDLVFALMLIADRRSPDLPERILQEMKYWCAKYATRPLRDLVGVDDQSLLALLHAGDRTPQAADAVWTLGVRGSEDAVPLLEGFLQDRANPLDHVSALALGKLKSRGSAQLFLSIALDASAPDPLRSSCFNSIGMIGAKECLPSIIEFLRSKQEVEGTVRENAAWALIGLVDEFLVQDKGFQDLIIQQLGIGRPYSRAMFAYLIGRFRIPGGLDRLIELAQDPHTDALFLEDIVYAIGEFGHAEAGPVLKQLLGHPDSIVRARVVEAAAKTPGFEIDELRSHATADEESDIVRDSARQALGLAKPEMPPTGHQIALDLRRRR